MKIGLLFAFMPIFLSSYLVRGQSLAQVENMQKAPLCYGIMKINDPLTIDGLDEEEAWSKALWTAEFVDIEGDLSSKPTYTTQVKMLWDDEHLYIYARMEEPHVWGRLTQRDTIIYHDNDFEIFIKPFEQHSFYYEIEVNALNTIMDLLMPKPYRFEGDALMHWDAKNLKSAVHIEGTLNNAQDSDQYWAVEMAIPFKSLNTFSSKVTPHVNDYWRINFSRVQWHHEIHNGAYSRKMQAGRLLPEQNWVWSPIGIINMHYPERWGYVKFIDSLQEVGLPTSYHAEKMAWNIFYLQQLYKQKHKHYAADIEELEEGQHVLVGDSSKLICNIYTNRNNTGYTIEVKDLTYDVTVTLDNFGHYRMNYEH